MIRAPAEAVPCEYLEKTFIDRKKERSELRALLVLERRKLVVLSGERGCGKTALVPMFSARHEGDFPEGIFFASGPILDMKALQESFHGVHARPVSAFSSIGVIKRPGDYSLRIIDSIAPLRRQTLESVLAPFLKRPKEQVLLIDVPATFTRLGDTALPADYALVNLGNLTEHETAAAIRMLLAHMGTALGISEKTTSFLHHLTGGNPFALQTALAYLKDHGFSEGKLRNALGPFQRPGIVGPDGRPLTPDSHAYKRIVTDVSQVSDELLAKLASDPKELYKLSSRLFEEVVAELLRRLHYNVTLTPASGDGGKRHHGRLQGRPRLVPVLR
jgi:restriction system protein